MILVTGATGHLGANLVRRLLADGCDVRVLLREANEAPPALKGLAVDRVFGDLRDVAATTRAVADCTQIYHCAARVSTAAGGHRDIYDTNVLGTRNILDAARRAEASRVVVTGSFGASGSVPGTPGTEDVPFYPFDQHTPYAHTKALTEFECFRAAASGLNVVIAVSTAIIGPHDYQPSRMGRMLLDFANGRLRAYLPGGFAFVSVRDLVEGHVLAMRHGRAGRKYLLSTEFRTVDQLMDDCAVITGRPRPALRINPGIMAGLAAVVEPVTGFIAPGRELRFSRAAVRFLRSQRRADCSRAVAELGYQPSSLDEAIEQAYACFVRRGLVHPPRRRPTNQTSPATVREVRS